MRDEMQWQRVIDALRAVSSPHRGDFGADSQQSPDGVLTPQDEGNTGPEGEARNALPPGCSDRFFRWAAPGGGRGRY